VAFVINYAVVYCCSLPHVQALGIYWNYVSGKIVLTTDCPHSKISYLLAPHTLKEEKED